MALERQYYTLREACEMLCISESTLRKGINTGKIPKAPFCGKILIPAWFVKQGSTNPINENIEIDNQKNDN